MKKKRNILAKLLSAVMVVSLMAVGVPGNAEASWTPETKHDIPGYQFKDIYATEKVKVTFPVNEVINSTSNPVLTKPVEKSVKFKVFNSTLQKVEQEVQTQNGQLTDLELIKDHNYIFFLEDSDYKMNNAYLWIKGKNNIVNIKDVEITPDNKVKYHYGQVDELRVYKRAEAETHPENARRVTCDLPVKTESGGSLFNVNVRFTSDVDTVEAVSDSRFGKVQVELLEDVNYMVSVENNTWGISPFPIVVKDKSEYRAGKYTYDYSSCAKVDELTLVPKGKEHAKDTVLTNKNYDEIFAGLYEGIAGNTTIKGMNFKDFLVLERKLDKSAVSELEGKDYDVLELSLINPHRWEIARLVTGNYEITEELDNGKRVEKVYYVDGGLKELDFKQSGNKVTFSMNSLSVYPIVLQYGESVPAIDDVNVSLTEVNDDSAKAKVTVTGSMLPEKLAYNTFYKKAGSTEPEKPEVDPKVLNVKVVDEDGKPVEGVELYLKSQEYGTLGDVKLSSTNASGKMSYTFTTKDTKIMNDDIYELLPTEESNYSCEKTKELEFVYDDDDVPNISVVDGENYTGEITLVVKKEESTEPEKPEVDPKVLNVKVVDEEGEPVEGVQLYLKYPENEKYGNRDLRGMTTGKNGTASYTFSEEDIIMDYDDYEICPVKESGYICEAPSTLTFENDDDGVPYILTVDEEDYTGEITMEVKSSATKAAKKVKTLANTSGEEQTLTDWIATGEAKEVTAKGDENERTFEVTFPVKDFPKALKWTAGVAFELADVTNKQDVKGNEVDIAAYETERQEALDQLKQEIKDAEEYINTLKEKEYTKESWKAYKDAIKEAKDMVEKSASKDEYLAVIQKLADAKAGLRKVNQPGEIPGGGTGTGGTGTGGNGSGSGNNSGSGNGSGNGNPNAGTGGNGSGAHGNSQKAPQTGDATPLIPLAVSIFGTLAVILTVAAVKRRAK